MHELTYFTAVWCQPCNWFGPVVDFVRRDYPGLTVTRLDVDQLSEQEAVMSGVVTVPTLVLSKDGQEIARAVGTMNERKLREWLDKGL